MLDIKFIRENVQLVKEAAKNKNVKVDIDQLLVFDEKRRRLNLEVETLRAKRNEISDKLKNGKDDKLIAESKDLKEQLGKLEPELEEVETQFKTLMMNVPNIPTQDPPVGATEAEN